MNAPLAPCGRCRALVPRDTGCVHWRPDLRGERRPLLASERSRRYRERKRLGLVGPVGRPRASEQERAAREAARGAQRETRLRDAAREAVAEFRRQMLIREVG